MISQLSNRIEMRIVEDPCRVQDFQADQFDNVYTLEGEPVTCTWHKRLQMKHSEGMLYCGLCELEGDIGQ
jgi:hypothetical protein